MQTQAVVFEQPERIGLQSLHVADPGAGDVVVKFDLERHQRRHGEAPVRRPHAGSFPEWAIRWCPATRPWDGSSRQVATVPSGLEGSLVFVPGARGYRDAAALFGASAAILLPPLTG
jgi:3-hydroxyethyl bacteriochlorophyllide a dehydrogenase